MAEPRGLAVTGEEGFINHGLRGLKLLAQPACLPEETHGRSGAMKSRRVTGRVTERVSAGVRSTEIKRQGRGRRAAR